MKVFRARNVHQMLPEVIRDFCSRGIPGTSRNGEVLVHPEPVTLVYAKPQERVIFWPERDAHPLFHFAEALWMLAGRNDVFVPGNFVKRMYSYSDDGSTLFGAYGHRWRKHFDYDQLAWAIKRLKADPNDRRVVIQMWDARADPKRADINGKDVCCNTQIYLLNSSGRLNMTVTARSIDAIWGGLGANAVHMSMLQEYLAGMIGMEVGQLYHVANNFHAYPDVFEKIRGLQEHAQDGFSEAKKGCPYSSGNVVPYPMMNDPSKWDLDLALFMEDPGSYGFTNLFFSRVAKPLWWAHVAYKEKDIDQALELASRVEASDWRKATREWLMRRLK